MDPVHTRSLKSSVYRTEPIMQGRGAAVVRTAGLFLIITASVKCESFETTNCVSVRVSPRKNRYGSQDSEVLFLHVGKAGGGSVWHWMQHNGLASQINVKHPNYELTQQDAEQYKHIIINVREPVARANSALSGTQIACDGGESPKPRLNLCFIIQRSVV